MNTLPRIALISICTFLVVFAGAGANDDATSLEQWPHWRGPLTTGASPHGDPPINWDEKTNIKWKAALPGRGSATPIVWGDCVFIAAARDTGRVAKPQDIPKVDFKHEIKTQAPNTYHQFLLMCFDRQTGKLRWEQVCAEKVPHEGFQPTHSYAAGSPTTDGKHVWVSFGSQGVYCFDFAGKLQWQRDLGMAHTRYAFGEASTPVLHGNDLIINWDQEVNSRLIVLDARTGQTRLQVDRDETTTWNTPLVVEHNGQTQVILNGKNRVRSYDLASGKLIWQIGGMTVNPIPSAVTADGVVYIMSGFMGSLAVAVPLEARGELTGTDKVLWQHQKGTPYCPSPLLVDGKLYFTQSNDNRLTCLDAKSGKVLMDRELLAEAKNFYSSPVAAAGRIYLVDRDAVGLVLKQSDKLEMIAVNRLEDNIDASPAVVGKQLFLRGHKYVYCIEQQ
jgi:outer membrane protein assembly factor BamB